VEASAGRALGLETPAQFAQADDIVERGKHRSRGMQSKIESGSQTATVF
jgi:hypothetical protein